jgi:hypothetical protein
MEDPFLRTVVAPPMDAGAETNFRSKTDQEALQSWRCKDTYMPRKRILRRNLAQRGSTRLIASKETLLGQPD